MNKKTRDVLGRPMRRYLKAARQLNHMGGKGKKRKKSHIVRLLKIEYKIGDIVPVSAIYECGECENLTAYKKGERFVPCEERHDDEDEHWYRTNEFVHFVSKNLNTEFERIEGFSLKAADIIAEWAGSIWFVFLHIIWFWFWIHVNTGNTLFGITDFDPYPFGLLTMIVSLEAIFLSTFILISQNRSGQKSELRAELDYQTNLKTEKEVAEILSILHQLRDDDRLSKRETDEVLRDAHIVLKKTKKRKRNKKNKKVKAMIRSAGIDIVTPASNQK